MTTRPLICFKYSKDNKPQVHRRKPGNDCLASLSQSQFDYFCSDIYKTHCSNQVVRRLNQVSDSLGVDTWAHSWTACGALKPWRKTMEMSDWNRRVRTLVKKTSLTGRSWNKLCQNLVRFMKVKLRNTLWILVSRGREMSRRERNDPPRGPPKPVWEWSFSPRESNASCFSSTDRNSWLSEWTGAEFQAIFYKCLFSTRAGRLPKWVSWLEIWASLEKTARPALELQALCAAAHAHSTLAQGPKWSPREAYAFLIPVASDSWSWAQLSPRYLRGSLPLFLQVLV